LVQSIQPCFVLAPQAPTKSQWLNTNFKKTPFTNYNQDEIPESDAMKMIIDVIHQLKKEFSLDADRIYVTGASMGGSGTWDIITRYPKLFAAAAPINGVSDPAKASLIAHMPIWAFHGQQDKVSAVQNTRNMIRELRKNGSACRYTEFEDLGHGILDTVHQKTTIVKWLFSQEKQKI
jgi:predicted peptidase